MPEGPLPGPNRAPGPRGFAHLSALLMLRKDRLAFLTMLARNYGDFAEFRLNHRRYFFLNDPRQVRQVLCERATRYKKGIGLQEAALLFGQGLLTSEGASWGRQRQLLQPLFSHSALDAYVPAMAAEIEKGLDEWLVRLGTGRRFDLAREMSLLTLRIAGRSFFDADFSGTLGLVSQAQSRALEAATGIMVNPWRWPAAHHRRNLTASVEQLDRHIADLVSERRRHALQGSDLLSVLLRASAANPTDVDSRQIRDELATFLVIGHETTACALAWTWHLLFQTPAIARRVQEETRTVLPHHVPTSEDLGRLILTRRVIEEAIRLYPPVWLIPREARDDDEIDGIAIPRGSGVLISPYTLHRHPSFWKHPHIFDPDRFGPGEHDRRPPHTYLPFGAGPRSCLAGGFAMAEAVLIVALILRRYDVIPVHGYRVRPRPLLTLRVAPQLPVQVEKRNDCGATRWQEIAGAKPPCPYACDTLD